MRILQIKVNGESKLVIGWMTFEKVDEQWHSIALTVKNGTISAGLDSRDKKPVFEMGRSGVMGAKLVLGDPKRGCETVIGCVKDLVGISFI